MKQTLLLLALSLFYSTAFSQKMVFYQTAKTFSYGPRIGLNTSTLFFKGDKALTDRQGIRVNFNGGIWGRYQLSDRWSVQANIDYSPRGSQVYKLNFIDVPLTISYNVRYKLFKMPMNFDFYAGLQPSFLTKATYEETINGQKFINNNPENITKTNLDFVIGSGFPMGRFLFYATNKINLKNLNSGSSSNSSSQKEQGDLPTNFLQGWSTEWFIGYRFGSSNSFKPVEK